MLQRHGLVVGAMKSYRVQLPVTGSYTSTVEVLRSSLSNPPRMYILSFNTAPAISDLAVGIDVPVVQYGSVDTDKEKANWEIEDGKMLMLLVIQFQLRLISNYI